GPEEWASKWVAPLIAKFGPAATDDLLARLDLRGAWRDAEILACVCRLDPGRGRAVCEQAIDSGSHHLQRAALDLLVKLAPERREEFARRLMAGGGSMIRDDALEALAGCRSDSALETLFDTFERALRRPDTVQSHHAVEHLARSRHPRAATRLAE